MTETKSLCRFFNYSNVVTYLEKMEEYLTLEESASGDFITYINNTGETCWISDHVDINILHKFEAQFSYIHSKAHFSYIHSIEELMLTDIQSVQYSHKDP